jgi:hypothetical protein
VEFAISGCGHRSSPREESQSEKSQGYSSEPELTAEQQVTHRLEQCWHFPLTKFFSFAYILEKAAFKTISKPLETSNPR